MLGFLSIIIAPGTTVRKMVTLQSMENIPTFIEKFQNSINMLKITIKDIGIVAIVLITYIIWFIVQVFKDRKCTIKNKEIISDMSLLIVGTLTYFAMIASPTFLKRVTFFAYVIYLFVFLKVINRNIENKKIEILKQILIGILSVVCIVFSYKSIDETFDLTQKHFIAWEERENEISTQIAAGKKDIFVKPLNCTRNKYMYAEELSISPTLNQNGSMAIYYGIDKIQIFSEYYLELEIENVNEKNEGTLFIKTNLDEQGQKIDLIDEELYHKVAPYRKYRFTYPKGDVTLYFAMTDTKEITIQFSDSQTITIKSIKLYTPENTILNLKGQDILNSVSLENIDIVSQDESNIVLDVQKDGKIYFKK